MNSHTTRLILALSLLASASAHPGEMPAEPVAATDKPALIQPLRYFDALRTAIEARTEIRVQQLALQRSDARVTEAQGAFYPRLDFDVTAQNQKLYDDFSGATVAVPVGPTTVPVTVTRFIPKHQVNAGLELAWNMYAGGKHSEGLREAKALQNAERAKLSILAKQVIAEVSQQYSLLRSAQIAKVQAERSLQVARKVLNASDVQFSQGRISELERDTRANAVDIAEVDLKEALRAEQEYYRKLLFAIGKPTSTVIPNPPSITANPSTTESGRDKVPALLTDDPSIADLDASFSPFASTDHPELEREHAHLEAAQARSRSTQADLKPTIDLFWRNTSIGRSDNSLYSAWDSSGRETSMVGVRLKWNFFEGFRTVSRIQQGTKDVESQTERLLHLKDELANIRAERGTQEAQVQNRLVIAEKHLELAKKRLRVAETKFAVKQLSEQELEELRLAADDAVSQVASLRVNLALARVLARLADY